jgi:transcriptional regulator with XRE-family HTH domain
MSGYGNENWQGERLREAAKKAGLPSEAIGQKMNRSGAAIRRYWDGTRKINLEDLKTYAAITGTDRPRKYWNDLKKKLLLEGYDQLSEKIGHLNYCKICNSSEIPNSSAILNSSHRIPTAATGAKSDASGRHVD